MEKNKARLLWLFVLLSLCAGCREKKEEKREEVKKVPVEIAIAKTGKIEELLHVKGTVYSFTKAIVSPKMPGKIDKLLVDEGEKVAEKQPLALLETTHYDLGIKRAEQALACAQAMFQGNGAAIARAKAALIQSEAAQDLAQAGLVASEARAESCRIDFENVRDDYMRMKRLLAKKSIPKQKYDHAFTGFQAKKAVLDEANAAKKQAEAGVRNARAMRNQAKAALQEVQARQKQMQAGIEQAKIALEIAKTMLEDTKILSPISGTITEKSMDIGEMGAPGKPVFSVEYLNKVKIKAEISSFYLSRIRVGSEVYAHVDGTGETIVAHVSKISPRVDMRLRMVEVEIYVNNKNGALRPGLFAVLEIVLNSALGATIIPKKCIIARGQKSIVYKEVDGVALQTEVCVGLKEGAMAQVSGILPGERVVVEGQQNLADKSPVSVQKGE